jgi:hypothetical protein
VGRWRMKLALMLLAGLLAFIWPASGCNNSSANGLENTSSVVIGYGWNSYAAMIADSMEIAQLEALFNDATVVETDEVLQQPFLDIAFYGEGGTTSFAVDANGVVRLGDGSCLKSEQIRFEDLYAIYKDYLSENK